jgi:hypothetical protein
MELLFGVEPHVQGFLAERGLPVCEAPFQAIGLGSRGVLKAVSCWTRYQPGLDITLEIAADFQPKMMRAIPHLFAYAFVQLQLPRISAEIRESNRASLRLAEWLGFKCEGKKRGTDIRTYGLTPQDWEMIRELRFPSSAS